MYKILIVDDSKVVRDIVSRDLREMGYEVIAAENASQALAICQKEKPDLVLMDIIMPGMDGITCVKEIKKLDKSIKVTMLSSVGEKDKVVEAINAGAEDFIVKPFRPERLKAVIEKLLGRK